MKSYIKIVKAMFSGNKRVLAEAFSVMVILLALEMTIPVCVNKMINGLAVENGIVTFLGGIFLFACAYGIVCFLSALNTKLYIRIGNQLLWNMREQIYKVLWYSGYMENVQKKKDKFKFVLSVEDWTEDMQQRYLRTLHSERIADSIPSRIFCKSLYPHTVPPFLHPCKPYPHHANLQPK